MPITSESSALPSGAPPSVLAGGTGQGLQQSDTATSAPGQSDGLKQAAQAVREMRAQMSGFAKQFPAAAKAFRAADSALASAMQQIIANPGQPEPEAPSVGG